MFKFVLVIQKLGFCLTVHYCYKKIVLLRTLSQNLSRLFHCSVIKVLCSFHLFETAFTLYQSCSNLSRTFLIHHNRKFAEHTFYYMYIICCPIDLFVSRSRQLVHNIICSDKCQHLFLLFFYVLFFLFYTDLYRNTASHPTIQKADHKQAYKESKQHT